MCARVRVCACVCGGGASGHTDAHVFCQKSDELPIYLYMIPEKLTVLDSVTVLDSIRDAREVTGTRVSIV